MPLYVGRRGVPNAGAVGVLILISSEIGEPVRRVHERLAHVECRW